MVLLSSLISFSYSLLRNLSGVLHSGCSHPQHHCRRVPFALYPLQYLLFVEFLPMAIVTGLRGYLVEVLICISLIFCDVDIFAYEFF